MKSRPEDPPASPPGAGENGPQPNTPNSDRFHPIPPQWDWHYRTLLHLRNRLTRAHAGHAKGAASPAEMLGVDVVDHAQEHRDRDRLWAELGTEDDRLFEIDCALKRISDGVYGFCEEIGHVIPPERLRAAPWTRYCRAVAEQREKHGPAPHAPAARQDLRGRGAD